MRELTHRLTQIEKAYDELKVKYKASLTKRREHAEKLMELTENSSSNEADMEALVEEVEKLNEYNAILRRELEGLTIRMCQELENWRKAEDLVEDKDHEISKLKQEISALTAHLQEIKVEKEEMQGELNLAILENATLKDSNVAIYKELTESKEILAKFNKSTIKLEQKLESAKPVKNTTRLGFSGYEEGETSGTKDVASKKQPTSKDKGKKKFKLVCFNCLKEGHTANVCRNKAYNNFPYFLNNKPRSNRLNGNRYACNKFGHRAFECRSVMHNTGRYLQRSQGVFPEPSGNRNPNWFNTYNHQSGTGGYQAATRWRATCLICHGNGHTAATCRRKNGNMNNGPWRSRGMVCYHCNKPGHPAKTCRMRKNISDDNRSLWKEGLMLKLLKQI